MAKKTGSQPVAVVQVNQTSDLIVRAERLIMMLLQRDREILERKHKLQEQFLEMIRDEKQGNDQLASLLQGIVVKASESMDKIIDLKKLQAMSPQIKKSAKARVAGAKSV
jgi:hypothetical protein